jgi:hypothetical protein
MNPDFNLADDTSQFVPRIYSRNDPAAIASDFADDVGSGVSLAVAAAISAVAGVVAIAAIIVSPLFALFAIVADNN